MFTTAEFLRTGGTRGQLRWGESVGRWRLVVKGVYGYGDDAVTDLDRLVARVVRSGKPASGAVAGALYGLDSVTLPDDIGRRWRLPIDERTDDLSGVRCTSGLQTMIDLAETLSDAAWEQALESALRKRLFALDELAALLPSMSTSRHHGVGRMRRVLALRPIGAPPTESLLETYMAQLVREIPGLSPPVRQYEVVDRHGAFVARVDLCWPDLGISIELDGQQHKWQPKYDARRQTRVVVATGWLCGRFTWDEVTRNRRVTKNALVDLVAQATIRSRVTV